jgi:DNA-binding NarL/FixJ family response regulator
MTTITIEIPQRNLTIIEHLAAGLTKKEIAAIMKLGTRNVERIIYSLLEQYGVKNTTELVAFMIDKGVIKYRKSA